MRPMLSQIAPADFLAISYPIAAEIKYDGIRTIAAVVSGKCTLYSRSGKTLTNFQEINTICSKMPEGIYDGEVISPNGFDALMTRAHAESGKNTEVPIEYKIFDKLTIEEWNKSHSLRKYVDRVKGLNNMLIAKNPSQLKLYYDEAIKAGNEGLILKKLDSPYESGSKAYWYKLKPKDTMDLTILAIEMGLGKNKDILGAFVCQGIHENVKVYTSVGTGFTDEQRAEFYTNREKLIGTTIEVEYQEVTKFDNYGNRSLRFPVFKCLRLDK